MVEVGRVVDALAPQGAYHTVEFGSAGRLRRPSALEVGPLAVAPSRLTGEPSPRTGNASEARWRPWRERRGRRAVRPRENQVRTRRRST